VARSAAYWATNLYPDPRHEPKPSAPSRDFPPPAAARFRRLREGLQRLTGVTEHVKFMGNSWRWTWEYTVGHRKLCWLHMMKAGPAATFPLAESEVHRAVGISRLPATIATAIREAPQTGPVKWCAVDINDQKTVEALLGFVRRKLAWVVADTPAAVARRAAS
jgi:Protein of unknown function (DUF3788)